MNIENIKSQFPIFSKKINGKPLVYLDSSNSSQKPMCVINRLNDFYKNEFKSLFFNKIKQQYSGLSKKYYTPKKIDSSLNKKQIQVELA